jgi:DNA-3-methyladenine glycosylase
MNAPAQISTRRLLREELPHDTIALARFLIGKIVVHDLPCGRLSGRIVEAEAYPPGDPAGHHFRGPTPRIRSMYLHPGHAYVFFNYGAHFMLNVASEPEGTAGGILLRALEPLEGVACMRKHRRAALAAASGGASDDPAGNNLRLVDLTRGPGRLAAALQIDRRQDGMDLCGAKSPLWLGELVEDNRSAGTSQKRVIAKTVRIGLSKAADKLWRFYERGNPYVSGPKRLLAQPKKKVRSLPRKNARRKNSVA